MVAAFGAGRKGCMRHHRAAQRQRAGGGRDELDGRRVSVGWAGHRDGAERDGGGQPSAPRAAATRPISPNTWTSIRRTVGSRQAGAWRSRSGARQTPTTLRSPSSADSCPACASGATSGPGTMTVAQPSDLALDPKAPGVERLVKRERVAGDQPGHHADGERREGRQRERRQGRRVRLDAGDRRGWQVRRRSPRHGCARPARDRSAVWSQVMTARCAPAVVRRDRLRSRDRGSSLGRHRDRRTG